MFGTKCKKCGSRLLDGFEYCYDCEPSTIAKKRAQGQKNLNKFYSKLEKSKKLQEK